MLELLVTVTVEKPSQLVSAVRQAPAMAADVAQLPRVEWNDYIARDRRSYIAAALDDIAAAAEPADVLPEDVQRRMERSQVWDQRKATADHTSHVIRKAKGQFYAAPGKPHALIAWVQASANTKAAHTAGQRSARAAAKEWAQYRDSLAVQAIGEWNVFVRRWAETVGHSSSGAWASVEPPTKKREPAVEPLLLNL